MLGMSSVVLFLCLWSSSQSVMLCIDLNSLVSSANRCRY